MKTILFSLALFFFSSVTAQEKEYELRTNRSSKFTFGWFYSPEVSYRSLTRGSETGIYADYLFEKKIDKEQAKYGQSLSFFCGYELSKTFTLEGGLGYTDFGAAKKPTDIEYPGNLEIIGTLTGSDHLHLASVPINLRMNFGENKVRGFVSVGIAPSIFMGYTYKRTKSYTNGDKVTTSVFNESSQDDYSKFILGAHISGGIEYHYNNKASLRIAPVFRVTATDVFSEAPFSGRYYNAGIEIGTVYKL